jgi:hypothetical protein
MCQFCYFRCDFHEELECKYCSLGIVNRYVWVMFGACVLGHKTNRVIWIVNRYVWVMFGACVLAHKTNRVIWVVNRYVWVMFGTCVLAHKTNRVIWVVNRYVWVMFGACVLADKTNRVIWVIVITLSVFCRCHFSNVYIIIFFYETTGPIENKLDRNIHWMVLYKEYIFYSDHKSKMATTTEQSFEKKI